MNETTLPSPQVEIRLQERWIPYFVAIVLIVQQVVAGKVLMAVAFIMGGLWLLSLMWARSLATGLRIERNRKYGWNQVGDVFEERVRLRNEGVFPAVWLLIEDHSTLTGHSISLGTGIGGRSARHWMKRTACTQRGEFQLGPTSLITGDPFGIYRVQIEMPEKSDFLVAPPVIPLPHEIEISTGYLMDDRPTMNRRAQSSNVSVSTRLYAPGDSLKRIHWLTTAREDQPYVRQFENIHASNHCWIVLDLDRQVHSTDGEQNSLEQSIILAISLANQLLLGGAAVGLIAQGNSVLMLPPAKGYVQFRRIQRQMATVSAGEQSLKQLLMRTWPRLDDAANLALISPSKNPDWLNSLRVLRKSRISISVFVLPTDRDPAGLSTSFSQLVSRIGIDSHVIARSLFDVPESTPGRVGVIDWKFTPLGRAIKIVKEGAG